MVVPAFVIVVFEGFGHFAVGVDVDVGFDDGGDEGGFAGCQGGEAEFLFLDLGDDRPGVVALALVVFEDFGELLVGCGGGLIFWFGFEGIGGCESDAEEEGMIVASFMVMVAIGKIDLLFVFGL